MADDDHRRLDSDSVLPDQDPLDEAIARLSHPISGDPADAPAGSTADLDALSVIAAALGRPLHAPHPQAERGLTPVAAGSAASGLLPWRVRLSGQWRDRVTVPLFVRTPSGPAALLPGGRGGWLVSALTRRTTALDRAGSQRVDPDAYAFAVDLPRSTGWLGLLRWSLRRQRADVWMFLLLGLIGGLAGLLLPLATGAVFDSAIPAGDFTRALVILAGFAVASAGAAVIDRVRGITVVRVRDRMDATLAPGVMATLLRLRVAVFSRHSVGDLTNRALSVETARLVVDDSVVALIVTSAFGLTSLGYLFLAGPGIGMVTTLAVAVVLLVTIAVQWRARTKSPAVLDGRSRTDALLLSILDSLVSWRVAGAEERALGRWARAQQASTGALRARLSAVSLGEAVQGAGVTFVLVAFTAAVVLMPGESLEPGSSTAPGAYLALYAAIIQVTMAMLALTNTLLALSEYGPMLARLTPIVTGEPERSGAVEHPGLLDGRLALMDVTFGYRSDAAPLFHDLSVEAAPGEFVAVVGPSGSGKSTLMRLLLGFETPWTGSVQYSGRDLAQLDPASVRRQLGVVLQSSRPLGRTVRECVTGAMDIADEQVWAVLERSGLADDVMAMPHGLGSEVGERGAALSGGQRQRLMIAAALVKEPPILLLDEATSALDNITQAVVMRTITDLRATRVVIAHRLSTVERADRVVVVADGRIVEDGPPGDLLALGGRFARLAARQEL